MYVGLLPSFPEYLRFFGSGFVFYCCPWTSVPLEHGMMDIMISNLGYTMVERGAGVDCSAQSEASVGELFFFAGTE